MNSHVDQVKTNAVAEAVVGLCGSEFLKNTVAVTTGWESMLVERQLDAASAREKVANKPFTSRGVVSGRFSTSTQTGRSVLSMINPRKPGPQFQIERELVEQKKVLHETTAGLALGLTLYDHSGLDRLKKEAQELAKKGPSGVSAEALAASQSSLKSARTSPKPETSASPKIGSPTNACMPPKEQVSAWPTPQATSDAKNVPQTNATAGLNVPFAAASSPARKPSVSPSRADVDKADASSSPFSPSLKPGTMPAPRRSRRVAAPHHSQQQQTSASPTTEATNDVNNSSVASAMVGFNVLMAAAKSQSPRPSASPSRANVSGANAFDVSTR